MRSRRCSGASRRLPPCAHRPPGSQSCAHLGLHRLARMPCTTEARMPGCSAFASPLQPSPSGAALRSGCMRLTRSCSSRLCRTFVPLAADLRKPAKTMGRCGRRRRLQGGCKAAASASGAGRAVVHRHSAVRRGGRDASVAAMAARTRSGRSGLSSKVYLISKIKWLP